MAAIETMVSAIAPQLASFATVAWPLRWLAFLMACAATGLLGRMASQDLTSQGARWGIVSFELARTAARAREIAQIWRKRKKLAAARTALCWDFCFIPAYVLTLVLACAQAAPPLAWPLDGAAWDGVLRLAAVLILVCATAGALDAVENGALLCVLGLVDAETPGKASGRWWLGWWAWLARWCALLKFGGLTMAVFFAFSGCAVAAGGAGQALLRFVGHSS